MCLPAKKCVILIGRFGVVFLKIGRKIPYHYKVCNSRLINWIQVVNVKLTNASDTSKWNAESWTCILTLNLIMTKRNSCSEGSFLQGPVHPNELNDARCNLTYLLGTSWSLCFLLSNTAFWRSYISNDETFWTFLFLRDQHKRNTSIPSKFVRAKVSQIVELKMVIS